MNVGSRGHPSQCRPPCKYVRRKGGCRDGRHCPNCHVCLWRRTPAPALPAGSAASDPKAPKVSGDMSEDGFRRRGGRGPHVLSAPCGQRTKERPSMWRTLGAHIP